MTFKNLKLRQNERERERRRNFKHFHKPKIWSRPKGTRRTAPDSSYPAGPRPARVYIYRMKRKERGLSRGARSLVPVQEQKMLLSPRGRVNRLQRQSNTRDRDRRNTRKTDRDKSTGRMQIPQTVPSKTLVCVCCCCCCCFGVL